MSRAIDPAAIDALVFDVQGTLLDFFTPVSRAFTTALVEREAASVDVAALTNHWRRTYFAGMERVTSGGRGFVPTATIYREGLDEVLEAAGLSGRIEPAARDALTEIWTALEPWPDTADGLRRLRRRFRLVALTNGGFAATLAMSARHDLAFHALLTSDLIDAFKPDRRMYRLAIRALGLPPDRIAMVASHPYDLEAAHGEGMQAIFIDRPLEFGTAPNDARPPACTGLAARDCLDLASLLGSA